MKVKTCSLSYKNLAFFQIYFNNWKLETCTSKPSGNVAGAVLVVKDDLVFICFVITLSTILKSIKGQSAVIRTTISALNFTAVL